MKKWVLFPVLILLLVSCAWLVGNLEVNLQRSEFYPMVDPDTVLYLRWVEQSVLQGKVISEDSYCSFPDTVPLWMPSFYLKSLVSTVQCFYAFFPNANISFQWIIGFIPSIAFFLLLAFLLFTVFQQAATPTFVLFAAFSTFPFGMAGIPFAFLSMDHHFLETFFIWFWVLLTTHYRRSRNPLLKILGGLVCYYFVSIWLGAPIFFILFFFYAVVRTIISPHLREPLFEFMASGFLIGGACSVLDLLSDPASVGEFQLFRFGWFQPAIILTLGFVSQGLSRFPLPRPTFKSMIGAIFLLIGIGLIIWNSPFHAGFLQTVNFLARSNPITATIGELQPIVSGVDVFSPYSIFTSLSKYAGLPTFFLPFLFLRLQKSFKPGSPPFLRDWSVIIILLGCHQVRFFRWAGPAFVLLGGQLLQEAWNFLGMCYSKKGWASKTSQVALMLALLFLSADTLRFNGPQISSLNPILTEAINWLGKNTPKTSGYDDLARPEYGILSFWDYGNYIAYFARRAVAVGNTLLGVKIMSSVFCATSEDEAVKLCRGKKIRYLFLTALPDPKNDLQMFSLSSKAFLGSMGAPSVESSAINNPPFKTEETLHFWLFNFRGIFETGKFKSNTHFRLRFSGKTTPSSPSPKLMIYEVVEGASIKGKGDPNTLVKARLKVTFGQANLFYTNESQTDSLGNFSLRVPYPTGAYGGRVQTAPNYEIIIIQDGKWKKHTLKVPETAVTEGLTIILG